MATQMTRSEFIAKYGDFRVVFSYYYKYTFNYQATLPDGKKITVGYGGNNDQIYRHEVASGCEELISYLDPYMGSVYDNGVEIESFYDY